MKRLDSVRVFTADGCEHSKRLLENFHLRSVRFEEINLSAQPEMIEELRRLVWERRLPVVVDHERVSIGFEGGSSTFDELGIED